MEALDVELDPGSLDPGQETNQMTRFSRFTRTWKARSYISAVDGHEGARNASSLGVFVFLATGSPTIPNGVHSMMCLLPTNIAPSKSKETHVKTAKRKM